jgi:hypothetical protein
MHYRARLAGLIRKSFCKLILIYSYINFEGFNEFAQVFVREKKKQRLYEVKTEAESETNGFLLIAFVLTLLLFKC